MRRISRVGCTYLYSEDILAQALPQQCRTYHNARALMVNSICKRSTCLSTITSCKLSPRSACHIPASHASPPGWVFPKMFVGLCFEHHEQLPTGTEIRNQIHMCHGLHIQIEHLDQKTTQPIITCSFHLHRRWRKSSILESKVGKGGVGNFEPGKMHTEWARKDDPRGSKSASQCELGAPYCDPTWPSCLLPSWQKRNQFHVILRGVHFQYRRIPEV